ncbi:hypothetical protein [Clostridium ganghwense]|uniref:Uncharacterized protein n=1 Tax=Clostridium ganghwense TaxID=312089 RepID=A0ABT4CTT5_9CLOT|nr:hypothetical protein [Clostridium ganghwense]MCY6372477.1 hypothetical protein [Clostridium ganghwense]
MFNPKKMLISMTLFAIGTFILETQFLAFPPLYSLPECYIAMGIPCGMRILNKLKPNFGIIVPLIVVIFISPFILLLVILTGLVSAPYYLVRSINGVVRGY